jgi:monofunctional biosynthetic peptidoglycan transglycosylase
MRSMVKFLLRCLLWVVVTGLALQMFFAARIALMQWVDPGSTSFQRSEAWRLFQQERRLQWRQAWIPYSEMPIHIKRAVIASEDALFVQHGGVDWKAIEQAMERNAKDPHRVRGGSTITQQLAKNLFLSGERHMVRKGQELVIALLLEQLLSKERILEIYLNHVEWGAGVFGIEAAAQHYFAQPAARLSAPQAARLAVMLPAPKRFELTPQSRYLANRTQTIVSRMSAVTVPE